MNVLTTLQNHSEGFLNDKKWGVEESNDFYTLFVEGKGKVYKKKLDKDYIKLGSEINKKQVLDKSFKDECLSIALEGFKFNLRFCINEIKQQITDDEVFEMANYYKQKHEKR